MAEIIEAANGYLVVCGGLIEIKFTNVAKLYCLRGEVLHHGRVCQNDSFCDAIVADETATDSK